MQLKEHVKPENFQTQFAPFSLCVFVSTLNFRNLHLHIDLLDAFNIFFVRRNLHH